MAHFNSDLNPNDEVIGAIQVILNAFSSKPYLKLVFQRWNNAKIKPIYPRNKERFENSSNRTRFALGSNQNF